MIDQTTPVIERFMEFQFVAAQQLPGVPDNHAASRLHGHTFQVRVSMVAEHDTAMGWIMDPAEMRQRVDAVIALVDHQYLNDVPGLTNPSTENLARYLKTALSKSLPGAVAVELWENPDVGVVVQ